MRHLLLILTLVLTTVSLCAQEQKIITKEDNNTFKVVYLNEDGNIMQQGFIKNNKLHHYTDYNYHLMGLDHPKMEKLQVLAQ